MAGLSQNLIHGLWQLDGRSAYRNDPTVAFEKTGRFDPRTVTQTLGAGMRAQMVLKVLKRGRA